MACEKCYVFDTRFAVIMAKKILYQCAWTGKTYKTEEEALKECLGPIQIVIQGIERYPKKGFFGTKV